MALVSLFQYVNERSLSRVFALNENSLRDLLNQWTRTINHLPQFSLGKQPTINFKISKELVSMF